VPLFFFDVTEGDCALDPTGMILADAPAARHQAIAYASERLKEDAVGHWVAEDWRIEVKDDLDTVVFTLAFSTRPASAAVPRAIACG
jgi:hypothetical protein